MADREAIVDAGEGHADCTVETHPWREGRPRGELRRDHAQAGGAVIFRIRRDNPSSDRGSLAQHPIVRQRHGNGRIVGPGSAAVKDDPLDTGTD